MFIVIFMVLFILVVSVEIFLLGDVIGDLVFGVSNDVIGMFLDEVMFIFSLVFGFDVVLFNLLFFIYSVIIDFILIILSGVFIILILMLIFVVEIVSFMFVVGNYLIFIMGNIGVVGIYDFIVLFVLEVFIIVLFMSGLGFIGYVVRWCCKL